MKQRLGFVFFIALGNSFSLISQRGEAELRITCDATQTQKTHKSKNILDVEKNQVNQN